MKRNVVIALVLGLSRLGEAVVTNVTNGGGLHATIQAAVNAANNGDTRLVSTGLY